MPIVPIDYPGINLPGSPSMEINDYIEELVLWGKQFGYNITPEIAINLVNIKMDAGLSSSPTFSYYDNNGQQYNGIYYDINKPIWHLMRDVIFLETFIHSVEHWEENYIKPFGQNGGISFKDSYAQAKKIHDEFVEYINENFDNHNPIVSAIIGSGSTSYGNFFTSDGALESFIEGKIIDAIEQGGSSLIFNDNFTGNILFDLDKTDFSNVITDIFINYYEGVNGNDGVVTMMKVISTGVYAIASRGLAFAFAPGLILYDVFSWIGSSFADLSRGAHLVNFYYLSQQYPEEFQKYALTNKGIIDFIQIEIFPDITGGLIAADPIVKALAKSNYTFSNAATDEQAQVVYSLASIMLLGSKLDIRNMKKNIAAFAYLKYLEKHSFELYKRRIDSSKNIFTISIPDGLWSNDENEIKTTKWYWAKNNSSSFYNLFTEPYTNSIVRQIQNNNQTVEIDINIETINELKKDGKIKVTIEYTDGFIRTAYSEIDYLPQHNNVQFELPEGNTLYLDNDNIIKVLIDGDKHEQAWLHWGITFNKKSQKIYLTEVSNSDLREYTYSFKFPYHQKIEDNTKIWLEIDGHKSNVIEIDIRDPNDADVDGLPDSWEMKYFGNLDSGINNDSDGDGKSNLFEFEQNTHPLKTGVEEILNIKIFETYKNSAGTQITIFKPYGDIYANVYLKSGTLDLNGRVLAIHGNLIHSGGQLIINSGKLIVHGDYRIQKINEDNDGIVSYNNSSGYLCMTSENDHVIVHSNFVTDSTCGHGSYLKAGILEVKGDFTQKSSISNTSSIRNFQATDNHKVIFSGSDIQTISFEDAHDSYSHFNIVEITNPVTSAVKFPTDITTFNIITTKPELVVDSILIQKKSIKLLKSITIDISDGIFHLAGSSLNLNGYTLTIKGDFIHSGGSLNVNSGKLIVHGDYRIQKINEDNDGIVSYNNSSGYLCMTSENDHVIVHNNFVTDSTCGSYLKAGILEVKGDFTQKSSISNTSSKRNFQATDNHKVIFSGSDIQTISFEDADNSYSHFSIVEIININYGIIYNSKAVVTKLFNHRRNPFILTQPSIFPDYDNDSYNDDIDKYPLNMTKWEIFGNMNNDFFVDLADIILNLQVISGMSFEPNIGADINNDKKIGIEEAIYNIIHNSKLHSKSD